MRFSVKFNTISDLLSSLKQFNKYKNKINLMIKNNDIKHLIKQLFLKPSIILSIINKENYLQEYIPLFGTINQQMSNHINKKEDLKFELFFLNCIFHYNIIILIK